MESNIHNTHNKVSLRFDLRVIAMALLVVIVGMLLIWKPWMANNANDRTITVTGEATMTDSPDEFTFTPSYEFKDANKDTALANLTKKSNEIVSKVKELGVAPSKIKTSSDGYNFTNYYLDEATGTYTYTFRPTIVATATLVQKVQDYLVSTTPSGQVSPQATFSKTLQKTIESKGRDAAAKDARAKADQSAKNLGFKVSRVKTIDDGGNSITPMPYSLMEGNVATDLAKPASSLGVQPGENDLTYSVKVTYYIR